MTTAPGRTLLLLIAGPIAAGKSAVSRALADVLRADGHRLALVELDQIADMARPTLPDWADAHRLFASVTSQWLDAGLDLVIAESVSSRNELELALGGVPAGTPLLTVVLTCDADTALRRAQADPTRGVSRQEDFLRRIHADWALQLPQIPADLVLDTAAAPLAQSVHRIRSAVLSLLRGDERPDSAEALIAEAAAADVHCWGFGWLEGRATEERPPWGSPGCSPRRWPALRSPSTSTPEAGRCSGSARASPRSSTSPSPGRRMQRGLGRRWGRAG